MSILETNPNLLFLPLNFYYLTLPLFYIYIKRVSNISFKKSKLFLILIPGIFEFIFFSFLYFQNSQQKLELYSKSSFMDFLDILVNLSYLFSVFYCILILKHIKKHQETVNDYYSNSNGKLLKWAKFVIWYLLIYLFVMTFWLFDDSFLSNAIFSLFNVIFIFWIGIAGIKQTIVFENIDESIKRDDKKIKETNKNQLEKDNNNFESIIKLMEEEKVFLHSNISLVDFSRRLSLSPRYLSELIKRKTENNFSQFVNHYRVEEAKTLLLSPEKKNLSIIAIGYDSGFSSKASFYKVFKEFTSFTPLQFIQNNNRTK